MAEGGLEGSSNCVNALQTGTTADVQLEMAVSKRQHNQLRGSLVPFPSPSLPTEHHTDAVCGSDKRVAVSTGSSGLYLRTPDQNANVKQLLCCCPAQSFICLSLKACY